MGLDKTAAIVGNQTRLHLQRNRQTRYIRDTNGCSKIPIQCNAFENYDKLGIGQPQTKPKGPM